MSKRSQAARRLSLDLVGRFGLRPGAVQIRWDRTQFPDGYRWGWLVDWADGPTVPQMQAAIQQLAGEALAPELARGLAHHRRITRLAWAMQLVAATQTGVGVGDVDDPQRWQARLQATEFPDRAANPEQERAARRLVAAAGGRSQRHVHQVLRERSLAGLATGAEPDPMVVVPLRRGRGRGQSRRRGRRDNAV